MRSRAPVSVATVSRLATAVLRAEKVKQAEISITFTGLTGIRSLNRRHLKRDHATDVIAFSLSIADSRLPIAVGDVYICPKVAAENARDARVSARDELRRLVIHGVLHVLGYDHPEGERRMKSPMWRRQERYLARFAR